MAKLITVFGATGQQGSSVIKGLLARGGFTVRGITRNPNGEKAKSLKEKGVEIVEASLDDQSSIDAAVKGSYGVFLVTNFWEFMDQEREIKQGKMAADACKKANVKHLVYSGLEVVKDITGRDCPHFDGKGKVEKYLEEIGIPYTSTRFPAYYENFASLFFGYQKQEDGSYIFATCMKGNMDTASVMDCGVAAASIFSQPEKYIGKKVGFSGDYLTIEDYIKIVSEATGKKMTVYNMSYEDYSKLPFPGAEDIAAMFHFYDEGNPDRDIKLTKRLNPSTQSFKEWVANNKDQFNF